MSKRIIHVVTNVAHYDDPNEPTGLWLSELTHAWDHFEAQGYEQVIVSPKGGLSPLEPRALKWPLLDASAKAWRGDPQRHEAARRDRSDAVRYHLFHGWPCRDVGFSR